MRRTAVAVAVVIAVGCGDTQTSTPKETRSSEGAATLKGGAGLKTAGVEAPSEPEKDSEPPRFDPADAKRTLRWIGILTQQARQGNASGPKAAEQLKATQKTLLESLKQTVKWKMPVEGTGVDGTLTFAEIRTTTFPDRSEAHPAMTLRIRAWNSIRPNSVFAYPKYPWLSNVRAGQDAVTVQGLITGINSSDLYNWYVSLSEIQFVPDPDSSTPPQPKDQAPERFYPDDADKSCAWLRQQIYLTLDPFGTAADLERNKKELLSQLRSLSGTKVRWRCPAAMVNEFGIVTQNMTFDDYQHQVSVAMTLWLKQPKITGKSGQSRAQSRLEYAKEFAWPAGTTKANPEVIGKIREAKSFTVSGKIAKVAAADGGIFPPRALEIAVRLDDVVVEP
jgi:hypothetical protein